MNNLPLRQYAGNFFPQLLDVAVDGTLTDYTVSPDGFYPLIARATRLDRLIMMRQYP